MLTNSGVWTKIHSITMAEVAESISSFADWQIAAKGKGMPPKGLPVPNGSLWGCAEYA
jgi:hypothetical protein